MKCENHPEYDGTVKPPKNCKKCVEIFHNKLVEGYKRYAEAKKASKKREKSG